MMINDNPPWFCDVNSEDMNLTNLASCEILEEDAPVLQRRLWQWCSLHDSEKSVIEYDGLLTTIAPDK